MSQGRERNLWLALFELKSNVRDSIGQFKLCEPRILNPESEGHTEGADFLAKFPTNEETNDGDLYNNFLLDTFCSTNAFGEDDNNDDDFNPLDFFDDLQEEPDITTGNLKVSKREAKDLQRDILDHYEEQNVSPIIDLEQNSFQSDLSQMPPPDLHPISLNNSVNSGLEEMYPLVPIVQKEVQGELLIKKAIFCNKHFKNSCRRKKCQ